MSAEKDEQPTGESQEGGVSALSWGLLAALVCAAVVIVAFDGTSRVHGAGLAHTQQLSELRTSSYGAALKTGTIWTMVRSGYDPLPYFTSSSPSTDKRSYAFLSGYDGIIEPYADNDLYISGYNEEEEATYYYTYKVCSFGEGKKTACESGKLYSYAEKTKTVSVAKDCAPFETLSVTIYKLSKHGNKKKGKTTGSLLCMYVRREMRALSEDDLSKTMDAFYNLYSTPEEEGQAAYGENWHNSTYFTKVCVCV